MSRVAAHAAAIQWWKYVRRGRAGAADVDVAAVAGVAAFGRATTAKLVVVIKGTAGF